MARKTQNKSLIDKLFSKINTVWGAIIAGCTIFVFGFGASSYVLNIFSKIEIHEINQKHNEQLYEQKKVFDKQIEALIHQNNLLEIENGKLKKE